MIYLSQRQKEIATGLVILLGVTAGFVGGEVLIRGEQLFRFGQVEGQQSETLFYHDEELGMRLLRPNVVVGNIETNDHGFRSPALDKITPQTVRIAFMGSSTVLNPYVKQLENTWPHRVYETLQRQFTRCHFDYLNVGIPGTNLKGMIEIYQTQVVQHQPHWIIVLPSNRTSDVRRIAQQQQLGHVNYRPSWLAQQSQFWSKIELNAFILARLRKVERGIEVITIDEDDFKRTFQSSLDKLLNTIESHSPTTLRFLMTVGGALRVEQTPAERQLAMRTTVRYNPQLSSTVALQMSDLYNQIIVNTTRRQDALLIDGHDYIPPQRQYYVDSTHLTTKGAKAMAERVSQQLLASPQVAQWLETRGCLGENPIPMD
ncbi:MAG: SGNH/GDSL hydrolase family protein [Candidatus Competibacterales bacterium]